MIPDAQRRTVESDPTAPGDSAPAGTAPQRTILCVDDEAGILGALKRVLRPEGVTVLTAAGGMEALEILETRRVDVIISDMRMPEMDGAQLLEQVCSRWPQTVRMLLTGHSDPAATVAAVNRGRIFRYLQKPWEEAELLAAVRAGLELADQSREDARLLAMAAAQNAQLRQLDDDLQQLQQQNAADRRNSGVERQRRYLQSVKVLTNLLEVRCAGLFAHGKRVATLARDIARRMELGSDEVLDVFVAGLLHDIGLIGIPDAELQRFDGSGTPAEAATWHAHPEASARALAAMEDMVPVARLIEAHHEHVDGSGFPAGLDGDRIPLGARILALADAVDDHENGRSGAIRCSGAALLDRLAQDAGRRFDPAVVEVFARLVRSH